MPFKYIISNDIIEVSKEEYEKVDELYKIEFKEKGHVLDMYGVLGFIGDIEFSGDKGVKFQYNDKFYKIEKNVIAFKKIMDNKLYFFYEVEKYTSNLFIGTQK